MEEGKALRVDPLSGSSTEEKCPVVAWQDDRDRKACWTMEETQVFVRERNQ